MQKRVLKGSEELRVSGPSSPVAAPSVRDLADPRAFFAWRDAALRLGVPRSVLADALVGLGSDLAMIRAATILSVDAATRERAYELCAGALDACDPVDRAFAECWCAYLLTLSNFEPVAGLTGSTGALPNVLETILNRLDELGVRSPLAREVRMKAHLSLAEAYIAVGELDHARSHATRVMLIAPSIGLRHHVLQAEYLLADVAMRHGNPAAAESMFSQIASHPDATSALSHDSTVMHAIAKFWLGDESTALRLLEGREGSSGKFLAWLEAASLRHSPRLSAIHSGELDHVAASILEFASLVCDAQQQPPDSERRRESYRRLRRLVDHRQTSFTPDWQRTYCRLMEVFASLKAGEAETAQHLLPSLTALNCCPPAVRLFGLALAVEVGVRFVPETAAQLDEVLGLLLDGFTSCCSAAQSQIALKLQLMVPVAAALAACLATAPTPLYEAGNLATMRLRDRPQVFGSPLPPAVAARFTLAAFGRDDVLSDRLGGRQQEMYQKTLLRPYFGRDAWYEPVPPAILVLALLACRDLHRAQGNPKAAAYVRSAQRALKTFGAVPRLQRMMRINELDLIEDILVKAMTAPVEWGRVEAHFALWR